MPDRTVGSPPRRSPVGGWRRTLHRGSPPTRLIRGRPRKARCTIFAAGQEPGIDPVPGIPEPRRLEEYHCAGRDQERRGDRSEDIRVRRGHGRRQTPAGGRTPPPTMDATAERESAEGGDEPARPFPGSQRCVATPMQRSRMDSMQRAASGAGGMAERSMAGDRRQTMGRGPEGVSRMSLAPSPNWPNLRFRRRYTVSHTRVPSIQQRSWPNRSSRPRNSRMEPTGLLSRDLSDACVASSWTGYTFEPSMSAVRSFINMDASNSCTDDACAAS